MSQTKAQLLDNIKDNVQLDAQKALRFADSDSSHYVAFRAPGTVSSSVTWTLPAADGSANYVLATDGSGTLSWIADPAGQWVTSGSNVYYTAGNVGIGDNSPSNPLSVTGASAFNGDVQFTGASYNVTWDKSADDLIFNDNAKAAFGTGSDLQIYYTGSAGWIYQSESGNDVTLGSNGGNVWLRTGASANDDAIKCVNDGSVELYHDGTLQVKTVSTGLHLADSKKVNFGAGNDLQIYHSGSESFIADEGTGGITLSGGTLSFKNQARDETFAVMTVNGSVDLYYNNARKMQTHQYGVSMDGNVYIGDSGTGKLLIGAGEDLQIYHDGTNSLISNTTGELRISDESKLVLQTDSLRIRNFANDEAYIAATANGNVELYYNGAKRVETTNDGITVTGDITFTSNLYGGDGDKIRLGGSQDLEISHDGSNSIIVNKTGRLIDYVNTNEIAIDRNPNGSVDLYHDGTKKFETLSNGVRILGVEAGEAVLEYWADEGDEDADKFRTLASVNADWFLQNYYDGSWETNIKALAAGAVELYHDNSKKFQTNAGGCQVFGNLFNGDSTHHYFGDGNDLDIYHDGSNSHIHQDGTGDLQIRSDNSIEFNTNGTENAIWCDTNGAVKLYHDNSLKLQTSSTGVAVTGLVDATCFTATDGTGYSYVERTTPSDTNVPYNSYTTISSNYGWVLPSAGTYLLVSMMRTRLWGVSGYIHCRLYDTTNSAAVGASTRMMFEQGNSTAPMGWYNVAITLHWVHTCSGGVTINQQFSSNANDTGSSIQNDSNGRNYVYWQRIG